MEAALATWVPSGVTEFGVAACRFAAMYCASSISPALGSSSSGSECRLRTSAGLPVLGLYSRVKEGLAQLEQCAQSVDVGMTADEEVAATVCGSCAP